ncbi:hypothetical protein [uncultured Endozoicomonas sp.]|uniref:hypothetical protein n=1 Tax=uncultured Endozoicomonas sp. TaxID=432652 RepID=UPI002612BAAE|nr:hypothetical protein [uncultured Endozoicomonas sp.]
MLSKMLCNNENSQFFSCETCSTKFIQQLMVDGRYCPLHSQTCCDDHAKAFNRKIGKILNSCVEKKIREAVDSNIKNKCICSRFAQKEKTENAKENDTIEYIRNIMSFPEIKNNFLLDVTQHMEGIGFEFKLIKNIIPDESDCVDKYKLYCQVLFDELANLQIRFNTSVKTCEQMEYDAHVSKILTCPEGFFIIIIVFEVLIQWISGFLAGSKACDDMVDQYWREVVDRQISRFDSKERKLEFLENSFNPDIFFKEICARAKKMELIYSIPLFEFRHDYEKGGEFNSSLEDAVSALRSDKIEQSQRAGCSFLSDVLFAIFERDLYGEIYNGLLSGKNMFKKVQPIFMSCRNKLPFTKNETSFGDFFLRGYGNALLFLFWKNLSFKLHDPMFVEIQKKIEDKKQCVYEQLKNDLRVAALEKLPLSTLSPASGKSSLSDNGTFCTTSPIKQHDKCVRKKQFTKLLEPIPSNDTSLKSPPSSCNDSLYLSERQPSSDVSISELTKLSVSLDALINNQLTLSEWRKQKKQVKHIDNFSQIVVDNMRLSNSFVKAVNMLIEDFSSISDQQFVSDQMIVDAFKNIPEEDKKEPYRKAASSISKKLGYAIKDLGVERVQIKIWALQLSGKMAALSLDELLANSYEVDEKTTKPPSSSTQFNKKQTAGQEEILCQNFFTNWLNNVNYPPASQFKNLSKSKKTADVHSEARKMNQIFGGRAYFQQIMTERLSAATSALNKCLSELEDKFHWSGSGLFHYQTKITLVVSGKEIPVFKISKGEKGGANTCTLFFYNENQQIRIIAMGAHIKENRANKHRTLPASSVYDLCWRLDSLSIPKVIPAGRKMTITEKTG